ncbi:MAG TPA: DUF6600 domain-containing protein [Steroidobacteraceae bacterium]|nr:DUF6600 domain-containing protein [Steroidobacteraceae bacterium]
MIRTTRPARAAAHLSALAALGCALLVAAGVRAQDDDPPTRAARIAYIEGTVSFEPAGTADWVVPPVNRPMTTGDQLWADQDGRAELQLDGSALRLGAGTALSFLNLADAVTQIQLSSGTLVVHIRRLDNGETYEIDTPNLAFTAQSPGTYRVSVDAQGGTTSVLVRRGQAQVTGGEVAYSLDEGNADTFAGSDLQETAPAYGYEPDSLDAWSDAREARWERSASARYVAPDVVGYEDLDDQGSWTPTPQYGNVWIPRGVDPGWAPYTRGHWAYVPPWGYTWVDDQPWGFAPFHYGRWIYTGRAWGWIPAPPPVQGVVYVRPVYAPALVAWVGAAAGVAWFALGPREVYVPSYPVSRAYMNNINVSNTTVNTTTITNVYNTTIINKTVNNTTINYVNRGAPGAVVATSREAFSSAAPVARNRLALSPQQLAAAPVRALAPPVVPTRQAALGAGRPASVKPPASVVARPVVARTPPPAPQPTFEQRRQAIESNGGRPISIAQARKIQPPASARPVAVKVMPKPQRVAPPKAATVVARPGAPAANPAAPGVAHPPAAPPPKAEPQRAAPQAAEQQRAQQQQAAERAKQAEQQQAAERAKQAEQQRAQQQQAADRAKQAEQQQAAERAKQAEQQQAAERAKQAEQQQAAERAKQAEQQRIQQQQAAERAKQAEQQRAQQQQAAERAKQAEQQQAAERAKQAEQQRTQKKTEPPKKEPPPQ